jgi:hypothetical protein
MNVGSFRESGREHREKFDRGCARIAAAVAHQGDPDASYRADEALSLPAFAGAPSRSEVG